jgi:hypothetical protein
MSHQNERALLSALLKKIDLKIDPYQGKTTGYRRIL